MRKNTRLPHFQNTGILLKSLLLINGLVVLASALQSASWDAFMTNLALNSLLAQPILLITLLCLYWLSPKMERRRYLTATAIYVLISVVVSYIFSTFLQQLPYFSEISRIRVCLYAALTSLGLMYFFYLQARAYSPAIAEARLQALQARIRPHFLFNSINAVLSVIRSQPKQAETALEDLSDLFRVLMAENRDLVPLRQEIALCQQYIGLEKLRLEDRLQMTWRVDEKLNDALIPPLILQPLLENAVYHGIEPLENGGEIVVEIVQRQQEMHITIDNPYQTASTHVAGNKMALKNIQERLHLHFDLEAMLSSKITDARYVVHIRIPIQAK